MCAVSRSRVNITGFGNAARTRVSQCAIDHPLPLTSEQGFYPSSGKQHLYPAFDFAHPLNRKDIADGHGRRKNSCLALGPTSLLSAGQIRQLVSSSRKEHNGPHSQRLAVAAATASAPATDAQSRDISDGSQCGSNPMTRRACEAVDELAWSRG
jgi:hypothetical protein